MTNNERFNAMINECENPRLVLNAMLALAPMIREARTQKQREDLLAILEGDVKNEHRNQHPEHPQACRIHL